MKLFKGRIEHRIERLRKIKESLRESFELTPEDDQIIFSGALAEYRLETLEWVLEELEEALQRLDKNL